VFRIVHPFHPCRGRPLSVVTVRQNWGEELIYYRGSDGRIVSVPARWTDRIPPDPVVALSNGRSPFRLEDLVELTRLLATLDRESGHDR